MAKVLWNGEFMAGCQHVVRGANEEDVLRQAAKTPPRRTKSRRSRLTSRRRSRARFGQTSRLGNAHAGDPSSV